MIPGFKLELNEFCENCPDFDVNVEKYETMAIGRYDSKHITRISCKNRRRCEQIAANIRAQVNADGGEKRV